jgi:hypothetical protein
VITYSGVNIGGQRLNGDAMLTDLDSTHESTSLCSSNTVFSTGILSTWTLFSIPNSG